MHPPKWIPLYLVALLTFASFGSSRGQIIDPAPPAPPVPGSETPAGRQVAAEMDAIIIPRVDFEKLDIASAVLFLNEEIKKLTPAGKQPLFLRLAKSVEPDSARAYVRREVSITLEKCPLGVVLTYVGNQTNLRYEIVPGREIQLFSPVLEQAIQETVKRIGNITVDHVDFQQTSIEDFVAVLNEKCKEADNGRISIRISLQRRADDPPLAEIRRRTVTMTLHGAPLLDILQHATEQTDFEFVVEPGEVVIRPGRSDD